MDLSLEDIISQTKGRRGGGGSGRGRGAGRGRGSPRARTTGGGATRTRGGFGGGVRGTGVGRAPGTFRRSGNADGVWAHDKYQDTALAGVRKSSLRSSGVTVGGGGSKITISNLHYGVSDADIMELFGELGTIRYASVHYDRTGRSMGKADVVFDRRSEAQSAIQQYNGVPLDGRSMIITWAAAAATTTPTPTPSPRTSLNRVQGGRVNRTSGGGGGRIGGLRGGRGIGRGRGRGGRGNNPKPPTAAELDAELDAYVSQNQK